MTVLGTGAMITGPQLREARDLLGWSRNKLAKRAKVPSATVTRAEASPGEPMITIAHANALIDALCAGGIEFLTGAEHAPGVGIRFRERADGTRGGG